MAGAFVKVFSEDAATKTHGEIDGTIIDIALPHTLLANATLNTLRSGLYALGGWVGRGVADGNGWNPTKFR